MLALYHPKLKRKANIYLAVSHQPGLGSPWSIAHLQLAARLAEVILKDVS